MASHAIQCAECGGTDEGRRRCLSCLGLGFEDETAAEGSPARQRMLSPGLSWVLAGAAAVAGAFYGREADPLGDPQVSAAMTGMLCGSATMVVILAIRSVAIIVAFVAMLLALDGIATGFAGTETVIERAPLLLYAIERRLGL